MPESNSTVVLLTSVKNQLICNGWRIINFRTKILSEAPYLKSFEASRPFSSFSQDFTRVLPHYGYEARPQFLTGLGE